VREVKPPVDKLELLKYSDEEPRYCEKCGLRIVGPTDDLFFNRKCRAGTDDWMFGHLGTYQCRDEKACRRRRKK
jgi:hypothetical protein